MTWKVRDWLPLINTFSGYISYNVELSQHTHSRQGSIIWSVTLVVRSEWPNWVGYYFRILVGSDSTLRNRFITPTYKHIVRSYFEFLTLIPKMVEFGWNSKNVMQTLLSDNITNNNFNFGANPRLSIKSVKNENENNDKNATLVLSNLNCCWLVQLWKIPDHDWKQECGSANWIRDLRFEFEERRIVELREKIKRDDQPRDPSKRNGKQPQLKWWILSWTIAIEFESSLLLFFPNVTAVEQQSFTVSMVVDWDNPHRLTTSYSTNYVLL